MNSVSWCIRTTGNRDWYLTNLLKSIKDQSPEEASEILVCGRTAVPASFWGFRFFEAEAHTRLAHFGTLCNLLYRNATKDLCIFIDDDSEIQPYFFKILQTLPSGGWDLTPFRIVEHENDLDYRRWYDWAECSPAGLRRKGWDERADEFTYIGGGSLCVRSGLPIAWDEPGGRGEDKRFSKDAFKAGFQLKTFPQMEYAICYHFLAPADRGK